jgi:hypothetical protein
MDFEISGKSRANALGGLIISQSGVKRGNGSATEAARKTQRHH